MTTKPSKKISDKLRENYYRHKVLTDAEYQQWSALESIWTEGGFMQKKLSQKQTSKPKRIIRSTGLSACCKAEMIIAGRDGEKYYYGCTKCSKPCDMWSSTPQETTKNKLCKTSVGFSNPPLAWTRSKNEEWLILRITEIVQDLCLSQTQDLKKKIEEWTIKEPLFGGPRYNNLFNTDWIGLKDLQEFLKTL